MKVGGEGRALAEAKGAGDGLADILPCGGEFAVCDVVNNLLRLIPSHKPTNNNVNINYI